MLAPDLTLKAVSIWLGSYAAIMAVATAGVWGATEALGRALPKKLPNIWVALVLGIATAVTLNGLEVLPVVGNHHGDSWSFAWAVISGIFVTAGARQFNERVNPLGKNGPAERAAVRRAKS